MSTIVELTNTKEKLEKARQELEQKFQKEIGGIFKEFLNSQPSIHGFAWVQYTPYFNDGEECVFGVHDIYAFYDNDVVREAFKNGDTCLAYGEIGDDDESGGIVNLSKYDYSAGYSSKKNRKMTDVEKAVGEFVDALNQFKDEFRYAFGDHVMVTVTRDGIDINDYDHE